MSQTKDVQENIEMPQNEKIHEEKEFVARNSLLTDLYNSEHVNVIRKSFLVAFFLLYVRFVFNEFTSGSTITFGTKYLIIGFGNFDKFIFFWIFMFSGSLFVYPLFDLWSLGFKNLAVKKYCLMMWNCLGSLLIFAYYCLLVYVPIYFRAFTVSMATNAAILAEQIRFMMKTHAFLRHNCPRISAFQPQSDKDLDRLKFSSFFYYLFAPTLVYRDEYPRTNNTDWIRASLLFLELMCCLVWESLLGEFLLVRYKDFGLVKETYYSLISSILDNMLLGPFLLLGGVYLFLHVWLNLWSELLRFADRQFYYDWWNAQRPSTFYRNWNMVIHDYLHTYIYRDIVNVTKSKLLATQLTFYISILVHEYAFAFTVGFFMPIVGLIFITSAVTVRMGTTKYYNHISICLMPVTNTTVLSCYFMEYYARINCPIADETYWKYLGIRMLTCNGLNL